MNLDVPLVLTTRIKKAYTTYEPNPDFEASGVRWIRVRHPAEPITQYAFKWFNVDGNGRLKGVYQTQFTYKKGWQEPVPEPILCSSGYHILNANNLSMSIGSELWIVQVRGVVPNKGKSNSENVRPVARVCTFKEWKEARRTMHNLVGVHVPEFAYWNEESTVWSGPMRALSQRARRAAFDGIDLAVLQTLTKQALGVTRDDIRNAFSAFVARVW